MGTPGTNIVFITILDLFIPKILACDCNNGGKLVKGGGADPTTCRGDISFGILGVSAVSVCVNDGCLDVDESKTKEKLSPKLLHTFCVSKPNEILQLCWDTINDNRLFIAIGNPNKNDDHIQIWNVGAKKCEYIISFNDNNSECSCIEYIKCNPSFSTRKSSDNNRLIVSGYRYKDSKDKTSGYQSVLYLYNDGLKNGDDDGDDKNKWDLISKSNMMETLITCVEFNHNGKIIIVGGNDGYIHI